MAADTDSNPPEKVYRLLDGNVEAAAAIEQVVAAAKRELRVFDANPRSLHDLGFGSPARIEVLRHMLLGNRGHVLRIVLHDIAGIESELPRLINLLGQFSGQVQVHRTLERAAEARDPMIIADDAHFWRRPHMDHPRSVLTLSDAPETRPFLDRFEEIWEKSELAVSGTTLGL
jgi:hypothetical protein